MLKGVHEGVHEENNVYPAPLFEPQMDVTCRSRELMVSVTNNNGRLQWHSALPLRCGVNNNLKEG